MKFATSGSVSTGAVSLAQTSMFMSSLFGGETLRVKVYMASPSEPGIDHLAFTVSILMSVANTNLELVFLQSRAKSRLT